MACVTLKRPLEFDPLHNGSCSPRPHKRPRCRPMCVSPQSAAAATAFQPEKKSPFESIAPTLTAEQITKSLQQEIRKLKHRKRLYASGMEYEGYESPSSPPVSPSTSPGPASPSSPVRSSSISSSTASKEKPLFTLKQVCFISERLMKEREAQIREEYDKVLAAKLAEQYDCFVHFTADQIKRRLSQGALPSYLS